MKYKLNSDWTLFVAVNNLTNKQYAKSTTISTKINQIYIDMKWEEIIDLLLKYEF